MSNNKFLNYVQRYPKFYQRTYLSLKLKNLLVLRRKVLFYHVSVVLLRPYQHLLYGEVVVLGYCQVTNV